jgi:hypothetical protein
MKRFCLEFLKRGLLAAGGGPIILAIIYGILGANGTVTALTPNEVCKGIITVTLMAFIAAGIQAIYQTERLPLISATLIHGAVLYLDYLIMYLLKSFLRTEQVRFVYLRMTLMLLLSVRHMPVQVTVLRTLLLLHSVRALAAESLLTARFSAE